MKQFETALDYIPIPSNYIAGLEEDFFFFRAKGDGMKPLIVDGEMVLLKKHNDISTLENEQIVAIDSCGILRIKKYVKTCEGGLFVSHNKEYYNPIKITENVKLLGIREVLRF